MFIDYPLTSQFWIIVFLFNLSIFSVSVASFFIWFEKEYFSGAIILSIGILGSLCALKYYRIAKKI